MRKTKKVKKTIETVETVDVLCNVCGQSCCNQKRDKVKNPMYLEFSGLIEIEVQGGYDSQRIGDMYADKFSICEHCLVDKIYPLFSIPRDMKSDMVSYSPEPRFNKEHKKAVDKINKMYSKKIKD